MTEHNITRLNFNEAKALEVILWFASKQPNITVYSILKAIFYADELHISEYGRPILGGIYCAMEFGPVHSQLYDILKQDALWAEKLELEKSFNVEHRKYVKALREPDLNKFSKSDLKALQKSLDEYGKKSFQELYDKTHRHPAWIKATTEYPESSNPAMSYLDLIPATNSELREDFIENASNLKI